MDSQPLYDLAPLAQMMLLGIVIALGPVAWVGWRHRGSARGHRLQALTVLTLFLTFDLVLFGAFTRLTDSGLGCPDWPGCYGNASPFGARHEIAMAQSAQPTGPVTHSKAWIEMVHRYLATGVGALILALALATWWTRRAQRGNAHPPPDAAVLSTWWPAATLVWVCVQGAFGALTVTWKLYPAIVTLHLLGAVLLLALLCIQAVRYQQAAQQRLPAAVPRALRRLLAAALALLALQIALGGWVSTNYAVLACTEFPACQGSWWPPMNFRQAFEIWRELGVDRSGAPVEFAALTAIHYTHRLFAYALFVAVGVLAWRLHQAGRLAAQRRWLVLLTLLQLLTGLSNVILDWPLLAAVLHTGGAAAMMTVLAWALCASRAPALGVAAPQGASGAREVTA